MGKEHKTTSVTRAGWKAECAKFFKSGTPFKVMGISKAADRAHITKLAGKHGWGVADGEESLYVFPPMNGR